MIREILRDLLKWYKENPQKKEYDYSNLDLNKRIKNVLNG
jgi:hypothetical protein